MCMYDIEEHALKYVKSLRFTDAYTAQKIVKQDRKPTKLKLFASPNVWLFLHPQILPQLPLPLLKGCRDSSQLGDLQGKVKLFLCEFYLHKYSAHIYFAVCINKFEGSLYGPFAFPERRKYTANG